MANRWRENSSASATEGWWQEGQERPRVGWSSIEKKVMEAMEDYLENCAHVKVDIKVLEILLKPENLEVSPRYVLKYSTRTPAIFSSSSTHQRSRTTSWQVEDDGWRVKEKMVHGKRVGKTSGMILSIKEQWQRPRRVSKGP